ncbi:MAG: tetraacyldisaccharide 4'-kinase [Syntrophobacteraceae bacterium]
MGREVYGAASRRLVRIWNTPSEKMPRNFVTAVLRAASKGYEKGLRIDQARALASRSRLPAYVISIGNLVSGGTGKTPLVLWLCRHLARSGFHPAILSRGHGRKGSGPARVTPQGEPWRLSELFGDEPVFMAASLPSVPVWVGRERAVSGKAALNAESVGGVGVVGGLGGAGGVRSEGGMGAVGAVGAACSRDELAAKAGRPDTLVLDDGFQHLALARDLDIVLLDCRNPFGNGHTLPLGPLREPVAHLERADALVLTHADAGPEAEKTRSLVGKLFPGKPLFACVHKIEGFRLSPGGHLLPVEAMRGRKAAAFAGIAGPEGFFRDLTRCGIDVCARFAFPDHHRCAEADLARLIESAAECGAELILTTAKDAVRVPPQYREAVVVAEMDLDFGPDGERFREFLQNKSDTSGQAGGLENHGPLKAVVDH